MRQWGWLGWRGELPKWAEESRERSWAKREEVSPSKVFYFFLFLFFISLPFFSYLNLNLNSNFVAHHLQTIFVQLKVLSLKIFIYIYYLYFHIPSLFLIFKPYFQFRV
jgi:hypothetical protein